MSEPEVLTVLLVEDDLAYAGLVRQILAEARNPRLEPVYAKLCSDAVARVAEGGIDVILLELNLPDSSGVDTLRRVREAAPDLPIVVLTPCRDAAMLADALRQGAQNFLVKEQTHPEILKHVLAFSVEQKRALVELQKHYDDLKELLSAIRDGKVDSILGRNAGSEVLRIEATEIHEQRQRLLEELAATKQQLEQKNQRLSELYDTAHRFVDNVSHEFRTPLTVINEFTSIVREGLVGEVNAEQREYLDVVADCVDDLTIMVNDMLDISKLETGMLGLRRKDCRVEDIIQRIRSRLENKATVKKAVVEIAVPENLPTVYCDAEKAGRVIVNLVVNGIKFAPEGGHIRVWAREDPDNAQVLLGVTDDGRGISEENLAVIFERFKQLGGNIRASTKGFGLGLNIAKELVQRNLGRITVESQVGQGSTFSFSIPIADSALIITRHMRDLKRVLNRPSLLSLVAAKVNPEVDKHAADELDDFFHGTLRCNDLLFRTDQHTWVIAAEANEHDRQLMFNRIHESWAEENRNRPYGPLPAFTLEVNATYHIEPDGSEQSDTAISNLTPGNDSTPRSQRILVVDDDRNIVRALSRRLRTLGYDTLAAYDGKEGFKSAVENHPDLVLLDVRMPVMDGLTILAKLREREDTRAIPVVMVSASALDQKQALDLGARCFLEKPYNPEVLTATVVSALSEAVVPRFATK